MKKFVFVALIIASFFVAFKYVPTEGVKILYHYMFGDGSDLVLDSDYFPQSTLIISRLKKMKVGETRIISFNQSEDWRLSYAINGFHLTKTANGFNINQYIQFDRSGKVHTIINLYFFKFKFYDNWVHVKKCTPFWVRYAYKKNNL